MEFDRAQRLFQFLTEVELAAVPAKGDKLILDVGEEPQATVFEVYEIHYADQAKTDVNVLRVASLLDYLDARFPDIS
jgi:hypothetical protein